MAKLLHDLGFDSYRGRMHLMADAHRHNDIELNYIERGSCVYILAGEEYTLKAGDFVLFWASMPHEVVYCEEDTHYYWFTIPLSTFLSWDLEKRFNHLVMHGDMVFGGPVLGGYHDFFADWNRTLEGRRGSQAQREIAKLEIEALVRRTQEHFLRKGKAKASRRKSASRKESVLPEKVSAMIRFISEHFAEPIEVADIAKAIQAHPNYAVTLFKQYMGEGIKSYLMRQRLAAAQRLLATTDDTILQVAMESGFGSASRFYVAFQKYFEQTPKQYRKRLERAV